MEQRIVNAIGYLASHRLQVRYIVHGTAGNYFVPEEVLDCAVSEVEDALGHPGRKARLSEHEIAILERYLQNVRPGVESLLLRLERGEERLFVLDDLDWCEAREAAKKALIALGVALSDWERGGK